MEQKVKEFIIEQSKKNTQFFVLVAIAEDGKKFVVAGDHWDPSHVVPYERCWEVQPEESEKQKGGSDGN